MPARTERTSVAHHVGQALRDLASQADDLLLYDAWKRVLSAGTNEQLLEGLKLVSNSLQELRRQVESCPMIASSRKVHLDNIAQWEKVLNVEHLHVRMRDLRVALDSNRLNHLFTLNDTLRMFYPQGALRRSTITGIKKRIDRLTSEVEDSNLPEDLKKFLLSQLSLLAWALMNFEHIGLEGIHEVFAVAMARSRTEFGRRREPEAARMAERLKRPAKWFSDFSGAVIRFNQARTAIEEILTEFLPNAGGPPSLPPPSI